MKTTMNKLIKSMKPIPGLLSIQKSGITRIVAIILAVVTLNLTQGCYYFKVNTHSQPSTAMVAGLEYQGKNFILHFNEKTLRLTNVELQDNTISGQITEVPHSFANYQVNPNKANRYYKKASFNQSYLLNEVHLYVDEYADMGNNRISVPVSSVSKVEIYDKDTAATTGSWVLGTLGVIAGVYLILAILVLIFKESCPFIYTYDGDNFHFAGEIFSGAIQPGLERHDYLRLPAIKPADGKYKLKVTNEVKEIQHINLMELLAVDHPANVSVLMDKYGQLQTVAEPVQPTFAKTITGQDIIPMIGNQDDLAYHFNAAATTDATTDGIVLTFDKPEGADVGKLIIRAKNSLWIEHVFSSFHDKFGRMYNAFDRKEEKKPASELRELMVSQGFPLSVFLEKNGEWELQDFYEIAGPMAMKDDILAINFNGIESEKIHIKIETGLMFWDIDYVAMDFTENLPLKITTLTALDAIDENGINVGESIRTDDKLYYSQPIIGNEANLTFPVPEFTDEDRTVILHSKGYYKILREQSGRADWKTLKTFREPGRMQQFSKELYEQFMAISQQ
jgi:hypothetical protein